MIRNFLSSILIAFMLLSCNNKMVDEKSSFTGAEGEVKLAVLAPGHFHASLLQKSEIAQIIDTVYVFAPEGTELEQYLNNIESYNSRGENPTHWYQNVYAEDNYLDKFADNSDVNVVVLAGNNRDKTKYILTAIETGKNVLSDKPMAINSKDFSLLEKAYKKADSLGLYIYDMMTERYDLLNIIEKELISNSDFFGVLQNGTREDPAVYMESIHHFYKEVSGAPLIRPEWYYDVEQQGEGIADVTTHLIDQLFWKCFPDETINRITDVGEISAVNWPTDISIEKYNQSTGTEGFPSYLQKYIEDNIIKVNSNGTIEFDIKDHYVKLDVIWNWQSPEGGGDTFSSIIKGSKAVIKTEQNLEQNYIKQLYVQRPEEIEEKEFTENMRKAIEKLQVKYGFISYSPTSKKGEYLINIPVKYRDGHESHFTFVAKKFFNYLVENDMPEWEKSNTLTKYFITTKAVDVANE